MCGCMIGLNRVGNVSDQGMAFEIGIEIGIETEIEIEIAVETVIEIAIATETVIEITVDTAQAHTHTTLVYNKQYTLFVPESYSQSAGGTKQSALLSPPPAPTSRHTHTRDLPLTPLAHPYRLPNPPTAVSHCRSTAIA